MLDTMEDVDIDTIIFSMEESESEKHCEHDLHPRGLNGHADGKLWYCILMCECNQTYGVVIRCEGFIEWCTGAKIKCDHCGEKFEPGWPWHIRLEEVK